MTTDKVQRSPGAAAPGYEGDAIRTEGLSKRFGQTAAVADLALQVPRGRTYGLIGLNGAGKSTTIRMIMGLLPPTSGRVMLRGVDVWQDPVAAKTGVGYVPDRPNVYPWMRIGQAMAFCKRLQPRWRDAYAADLLKRFRLDPDQKVGKLSKGMAAKLSLLLALAHDPEVLILDEPTDGLDPVARDDFLEGVLAAACEQERSVLMSSHALDDVQRMADTIGLMHGGRLVIQRPTEELVRTTKRLRMVLPDGGPPPPAVPGAILQRREGRQLTITVCDFAPAAVEGLRTQTRAEVVAIEDLTLDEIFKDLVRGREAQA